MVALVLFVIGLVAELFIYSTSFGWRYKKIFAGITLATSSSSVGLLVPTAMSAATVLFALLMVYRVVNILRLVEGRMHERYLKNVTKRSYLWLGGAQLFAIGLWFLFTQIPSVLVGTQILTAISASLCIASILIILYTIVSVLRTKSATSAPLSDKELPTVTIAIAARNETQSLTQCLEAALASDYPKLEIIVLDDCSQDHTAVIIKSFAHDGVRFVQGDEPSDTWLAKNAAYHKLLSEATGQLILYMGVDARLHEQSLRRLVEAFKAKNVAMLSVLPKRTKSGLLAAFIQPMRYWWELALPRFVIKHEPVLSTCWLVNRQALLDVGGFKAVTRAITPEEHLSTMFHKNGGYAFIRTNDDINITTHKDFHSQWLTALRTRYPQMHRRPELTSLRVIIMLYFLITPYALLPLLIIFGGPNIAIALTTISVVMLSVSHVVVSALTNPVAAWLAPINFPIVVIIDFIALHISMYRYEFGEVIWKGRNVTGPAMHVVPHLPAID